MHAFHLTDTDIANYVIKARRMSGVWLQKYRRVHFQAEEQQGIRLLSAVATWLWV